MTKRNSNGSSSTAGHPAALGGATHGHRVLFVITSSGIGGAERILQRLIMGLDTRAFEPVLCTLRPEGDMAADVRSLGVEVLSLGMPQRPSVKDMYAASQRLADLMDRYRIDLSHSFLYRANVLTRVARKLSNSRPIVLTGHHSLTPPPTGRFAVWSERLTHALSDWCIAVSDAVRRSVIEYGTISAQRVVVIPNGVDTNFFVPVVSARRSPRVVIGAAGRLSKIKGFDILLHAVAQARQAGADVELRVAGAGPEGEALVQLRDSLGLREAVSFAGMLADLRTFYAGLDIFVLSSLEEASPTVVIEAMSSGLPVIATRCGGAVEMVEHGISGHLVAPASADELARAIVSLASGAAERSRLGAGARARAVSTFDVRQMISRHEHFYAQALACRHEAKRPVA